MKINRNAEGVILKELQTLAQTAPSYRLLYIRTSQLDEPLDEWFDDLVSALKGNFFEDLHTLYICHDDDVFVLGRFWTHKKCEKLLETLAPRLASVPDLLGLTTLFEISRHMGEIRRICRKKYDDYQIVLRRQRDAEQAQSGLPHKKLFAGDLVNEELVKSITKRRASKGSVEVMVVEDDPFSQRLIGNALKTRYSLCVSGDGESAILNYVNKVPGIIFLDIELPDIDGHEVLQKLLSLDPEAYVIMLSGNSDKENILKAIQQGAKGFVAKPFTTDKLMQYINKSPFMNKSIQQGEPA